MRAGITGKAITTSYFSVRGFHCVVARLVGFNTLRFRHLLWGLACPNVCELVEVRFFRPSCQHTKCKDSSHCPGTRHKQNRKIPASKTTIHVLSLMPRDLDLHKRIQPIRTTSALCCSSVVRDANPHDPLFCLGQNNGDRDAGFILHISVDAHFSEKDSARQGCAINCHVHRPSQVH